MIKFMNSVHVCFFVVLQTVHGHGMGWDVLKKKISGWDA